VPAADPALPPLASAPKRPHLPLALNRHVRALTAVRARGLCLLKHGSQGIERVPCPEGRVEVGADEKVIAGGEPPRGGKRHHCKVAPHAAEVVAHALGEGGRLEAARRLWPC